MNHRWYDKPFTLVVFENARSGVNGEHTWADAIVVVRMFDYCLKYVNTNFKMFNTLRKERNNVVCKRKPQRMDWNLDQTAHTAIECASADVSKLIHASDLTMLQFAHFGNSFMKRYKLTPDFFVQMVFTYLLQS